MGMIRRMLVLAAALWLEPLVAQQCAHYAQDKLIDRLDEHLGAVSRRKEEKTAGRKSLRLMRSFFYFTVALCMDQTQHDAALEALKDVFTTNEFDRRHPLALLLLSNSSVLLHTLASAVTTALVGTNQVTDSIRLVDFQQLVPDELKPSTTYEIKQELRESLASQLRACPQRSIFIVDNVQALPPATLPVLDVFLDPLNGKRAQLQDQQQGRPTSTQLDCSNAIFVFLYHLSTPQAAEMVSWRDFMMQQWTRDAEFTQEEFTPQAFVGRITQGLSFVAPSPEPSTERRNAQWTQVCRSKSVLGYAGIEETNALDTNGDLPGKVPAHPLQMAIAILAYLAVLNIAKFWTRDTKIIRDNQNYGQIHNRKRKKRPGNRRKKRH